MVKRCMAAAALLLGVRAQCPDDPEVDLCGLDTNDWEANGAVQTRGAMMPMLLFAGALGSRNVLLALPLLGFPLAAEAASAWIPATCGGVKDMYKEADCCGNPEKKLDYVIVPKAEKAMFGGANGNICAGKKLIDASPGDGYFNNVECMKNGVLQALEQAGANITKGYQGEMDVGGREPIQTPYFEAGLCPVNVHWHLGTEHYSAGEFDEHGTGPTDRPNDDPFGEEDSRRLADARLGFRCHLYDKADARFTTHYNWQHCKDMHVGETYEVHWPHSAAGACGTPFQYQTPFYDGVFCKGGIISLDPLNTYMKIGVQGQIFTIINDEDYYYPDLMRGWIVDGDYAKDIAYYTGSTTGTSRSNTICSKYTPITWQVDRKCHLISASSFDKMCADMMNQHDDMSSDLHAHGSRVLVSDILAANNFHRV